MSTIDHVFVLMLENRSFDHFFGLSGLVSPPPASFGFSQGARDSLKADPPHEYDDVAAQVAGGLMTGFPASGGSDAMKGFESDGIPVLTSLANNYLLMDNWYSSMPGPTWPNRLFAHAASSGGLDNSLSALGANSAITDPGRAMQFDNGHIFQRLTGAGKTWRIYHGDRFPQVLSLDGMVEASDYNHRGQFFRPFDKFSNDLKAGDAASYTWIEPHYGIFDNFKSGNCQHPLGAVSQGERLIGEVYNSLRASPCWATSVMLIVWDEHGGFFDHASPPTATPPGDHPWNHSRARQPRNCKFDRLGPRVPALLISPWLPHGLGSSVFPGKVFDHASIVSSLRATFSLGNPLTSRDAVAPSWTDALLPAPREPDINKLRTAIIPKKLATEPINVSKIKGPPSDSVISAAHVARAVDWQVARHTGTAPLALTSSKSDLDTANALIAQLNPTALSATKAHRLLVKYMVEVDAKAAAAEKAVSRADRVRSQPSTQRKRSAATSTSKMVTTTAPKRSGKTPKAGAKRAR
jgi:phospholipase C